MPEAAPDKAAPKGFHATSIFPEYFKVGGKWYLAEDSRMDCVPVSLKKRKDTRERVPNLKQGDQVVVGRSEDCEEGIYVHADCFEKGESRGQGGDLGSSGRSRETGFSYDYKQLIELLQYERTHGGYIVWVLGPACSFDAGARECFAKLVENGYVSALLAGNALATHDLEGGYLGTCSGHGYPATRCRIQMATITIWTPSTASTLTARSRPSSKRKDSRRHHLRLCQERCAFLS